MLNSIEKLQCLRDTLDTRLSTRIINEVIADISQETKSERLITAIEKQAEATQQAVSMIAALLDVMAGEEDEAQAPKYL